ncbi:MAG: hypothetical protein JRI25_28690 [Deltaproteobacteria bacterium]|nr:hypothetical protein [Deltaproteobacteria bacterium]
MSPHRTIATVATLGLLAWGGSASAQDAASGPGLAGMGIELGAASMGLPLPYSERPLTLTEGTIRGDAAFTIMRFSVSVPGVGTLSETAVGLALGGGYGIMDDLEVGASVIPLTLSPDVTYGDPTIYGIYRFLADTAEIGGSLALTVPIDGDFVATPGLPVLLHLGDTMRLDTGVFLPFQFADRFIASLNLPATFSYNVTPNLFVGGASGILIPDFNFDFLTLPLSVHGGYTLEGQGGGPLADFALSFGFPALLMPASGGDVLITELWVLSIGGSVYIGTR